LSEHKLDQKARNLDFQAWKGQISRRYKSKKTLMQMRTLCTSGILYAQVKLVPTECKVSEGEVMLDGILIKSLYADQMM